MIKRVKSAWPVAQWLDPQTEARRLIPSQEHVPQLQEATNDVSPSHQCLSTFLPFLPPLYSLLKKKISGGKNTNILR